MNTPTDEYTAYISDRVLKSRNQMIYAVMVAVFVLGIAVMTNVGLIAAIPILASAVWFRSYEEAYKHYKSVKKGLEYEARTTKVEP